MDKLSQIRVKYPQYKDMDNAEFANKFYSKFYSDIPRDEFNLKVGYSPEVRSGRGSVEASLDSTTGKFAHGLTWGLSDELQALIPASAGYIADKYYGNEQKYLDKEGNIQERSRSFSDNYDDAHKYINEGLDIAQENNPVTSTVSEVAGGILGAGKLFQGAKALNPSIVDKAAKFAKAKPFKAGMIAGGVSSGVYGFNTGDGFEDRLNNAVEQAPIGVGAGLAGAKIAKTLANKVKVPTADEIRKKASEAYQVAKDKGGIVRKDVVNRFVDEVQKLPAQTKAGKILESESAFTKLTKKFENIRDMDLSLDELQEIDEFLGDSIDDFTENGLLKKQGKKILDIQNNLRNKIEGLTSADVVGGKDGILALKEGRTLWRTSIKLNDIERVIQRAELSDNPATSLRSGFRTLLSNPKRAKSFTKAERNAIKKAAKTGVITDILRGFGSKLTPIIATASGSGGLGGSAIANVGSMAARGGATNIQLNKATDVARIVANQGNDAVIESLPPLLGNLPIASGLMGGILDEGLLESLKTNRVIK